MTFELRSAPRGGQSGHWFMIFSSFPRALRFACLGLLAALATACAGTRGGPISYDVSGFGVPDAPRAVVVNGDYQIAAGDTLTITVFQVEDLSKDYVVDIAGNIAMPLIGTVPATGTTTSQLQAAIAERLAQRYMRNPDVTVALKESASRNITVDGSVQQPGVFPVAGPMTLQQAVALGRGLGQGANPRRVAVFRRVSGQRMAAAFDLVSIRRGEAQDPEVYAGDIVVVDGSRTPGILREILSTLPILALFRPY